MVLSNIRVRDLTILLVKEVGKKIEINLCLFSSAQDHRVTESKFTKSSDYCPIDV